MSRKPKYPEPSLQDQRDLQQLMVTLKECSLAEKPLTATDQQKIDHLLRAAEFGSTSFPKIGHYFVIAPHVAAARAAGNWPQLAGWAAALVLISQFEQHMPKYAALIRAKQAHARESAAKRRDEENNALTRIEAWERENGHALSDRSPAALKDSCAAAIKRSIATVEDALYRRARAAKEL